MRLITVVVVLVLAATAASRPNGDSSDPIQDLFAKHAAFEDAELPAMIQRAADAARHDPERAASVTDTQALGLYYRLVWYQKELRDQGLSPLLPLPELLDVLRRDLGLTILDGRPARFEDLDQYYRDAAAKVTQDTITEALLPLVHANVSGAAHVALAAGGYFRHGPKKPPQHRTLARYLLQQHWVLAPSHPLAQPQVVLALARLGVVFRLDDWMRDVTVGPESLADLLPLLHCNGLNDHLYQLRYLIDTGRVAEAAALVRTPLFLQRVHQARHRRAYVSALGDAILNFTYTDGLGAKILTFFQDLVKDGLLDDVINLTCARTGYPLLYWACQRGRQDVAKALLDVEGVDLGVKIGRTETLLLWILKRAQCHPFQGLVDNPKFHQLVVANPGTLLQEIYRLVANGEERVLKDLWGSALFADLPQEFHECVQMLPMAFHNDT